MLDLHNVFELLNNEGINFITGVPDSLLNDFCLFAQKKFGSKQHLIAANEGNAIAIASGYHFATGKTPLVYMQNSGLGNALNPLLSLTNKEVYSIPMVLLIGWRGDPSISDHNHHKLQGVLTPVLMDDLGIPYKILEDNESYTEKIKWANSKTNNIKSPVALIVKKGVLSKLKKVENKDENTDLMNREETMRAVIDNVSSNAIFIATTGRATREIFDIRNLKNQTHYNDILNVGSMGHASSIALGYSLGNNERQVICFDGDASALMHMGSFATNAVHGGNNFLHIILNNGIHESVGGQAAISQDISFTGIAKSVGYNTVGKYISSEEELVNAINELNNQVGPGFIDVRIRKGIRKNVPLLKVELKTFTDKYRNEIKGD